MIRKDGFLMKLSTKGRYGLRAMVELSINYGSKPIALKQISERLDISQKYLERLFASLKLAGLLHSARGAHGGYVLARHPSEINLHEVLQILEGSISPAECVDNPEICPLDKCCVIHGVWERLKEAMSDILESTTLQDLAKEQKKQLSEDVMYYI